MPDINTVNLVFNVALFVAAAAFAFYKLFAEDKQETNELAEEASKELKEVLRQELEAVRIRANRLHDDLENEREERRELEAKLTKLESLPDMTRLLEEMVAQREAGDKRALDSMRVVTQLFESHENRAQDREGRAQERHQLLVESFVSLNTGLSEINESLRLLNGGQR